MKWLMILSFIWCSSASAISHKEFVKLPRDKREQIVAAYKAFLGEYTKTVEVTSARPASFIQFIEAAYASDFDCVYGGWPSKRISGLCSLPRSNPAFQRETCAQNQMPCQPLLFGRGICVSTATREQRNSAFANCEKKFQGMGRALSDVIEYISDPEVSQEADELFQLVDQICSTGAQATTGMCRNLSARVREIKALVIQVPPEEVAPVNLPDEIEAAEPSVAELPPRSTESALIEVAEDAGNVSTIIEQLNAVTRCESCEVIRKSIVDEPQLNRPEAQRVEGPASENTPFPRIDSGYDLAACGGTRSSPDGYDIKTIGNCSDNPRVHAGFAFRPGAGHPHTNVQTRYPGGSQPGRFFEIASRNEAFNETYLIMEEYGGGPDSHNVKSHMFLIPRVTVPSVRVEGERLIATLPTGETVTMNKSSRQIIGGALTEGPIDLNTDRFQRRPPNIHYNGSGISIRLDHRYEHPLTGSATATVKQGSKTCNVPRTAILDQNGKLKTTTDAGLVAVLNQNCRGGGFSLP